MDGMTIDDVVLDQASSGTSSEQENLEIQCATAEQDVQFDIPTLGKFSIEGIKHNTKTISYYTGFNGFHPFMLIFNILGPAAFDLNFKCALLNPTVFYFDKTYTSKRRCGTCNAFSFL